MQRRCTSRGVESVDGTRCDPRMQARDERQRTVQGTESVGMNGAAVLGITQGYRAPRSCVGMRDKSNRDGEREVGREREERRVGHRSRRHRRQTDGSRSVRNRRSVSFHASHSQHAHTNTHSLPSFSLSCGILCRRLSSGGPRAYKNDSSLTLLGTRPLVLVRLPDLLLLS